MKIKINNADEYVIRRDVKASSWFKQSNNFIYDDKLFRFDNDQKLMYWVLIGKASEHFFGVIEVNIELLSVVLRIKPERVIKTLESFSNSGLITITSRERNVDVTQTNADVQYRQTDRQTDKHTSPSERGCAVITDQQEKSEKPKIQPTPAGVRDTAPKGKKFKPDFESVYQIYPRKEGKSRGIKRLKSMITTKELLESFESAVKNYARYCQTHGLERQFTKQFSTFVSEWEDWIRPDDSLFKTNKPDSPSHQKKFVPIEFEPETTH